eukprot:CAMPEP_0173192542 /NCGR_PEP_ID=MMETSP1141-20130122/13476_1 /TAXON_ID=483371 /ORGANISM="non described non described, Strain CCMP2298" /LENGTH=43 /DNA_ID= /DNA_START= /DNA_END= /DNA_ORIENTATION=
MVIAISVLPLARASSPGRRPALFRMEREFAPQMSRIMAQSVLE